MPSRPVFVASDQHLGAAPGPMESSFLRWLEFAGDRAGLIFLNGDLFDFWFEWGSVIPRGHIRILGALARIVDAGVPVHLMGGNHDWWASTFLTDEIGITFHPDPTRLDLAGHRALVAHGDGLGQGDLGYRMLRSVLRSGAARRAFRWVHPDVGTALARKVSRTDTRIGAAAEGHVERAKFLERWARDRILEEEELDLVILGHTHLPRKVEVAPGRFYLNAGDWLKHGSYIVLAEGCAPKLERWKDGWSGSEAPAEAGPTDGAPTA